MPCDQDTGKVGVLDGILCDDMTYTRAVVPTYITGGARASTGNTQAAKLAGWLAGWLVRCLR